MHVKLEELTEKCGEWLRGSGPQSDIVISSRIRLARNPTAWRPPVIDTVELRALPDNASRLQALMSGSVDVALNLNPDDKGVLESAGYRAVFTPRAAVLAIQFITERESPLRDKRVRQALNLAVDRERIVKVILGGVNTGCQPGRSKSSIWV